MATTAEHVVTEAENPLVEGLERLPVAPTTLVIFGATGDLAHRKLLPALYNLAHDGALPERFFLIGVARRENVTQIVLAESRAGFFGRTLGRSLPDALRRKAGGVEIHVVASEAPAKVGI